MDQEEFVEVIKMVVRDSSTNGFQKKLENPPGRSPDKKLIDLSNWYNTLDEQQKLNVKGIIAMAVDESVFGFLCVLDGVRSIAENLEDSDAYLKLTYVNGVTENVLNNPNDDYLHDLYNATTD